MKQMTAAELDKLLKKDSSFQKKQKQLNDELKSRKLDLEKDIEPLLSDLRKVDIDIKDISLLFKFAPYTKAIPILIKHLNRDYMLENKRWIVDSLKVPEAKGLANEAIIAFFEKETDDDLRWKAGFVLSKIAQKTDLEKISSFVLDKSYGEARSELLFALAAIEGKKSIPKLRDALNDSEQIIYANAISALGNLRAIEAEEEISSFLEHPDSWVRGEVKKAMSKISTAKKRLAKKGK